LAQLTFTNPEPTWGLALIALGEAVRLWAASHIGLISRTREAGVGVLVTSGPYRFVRNPLYVGNTLMAAGFGALSHPALALAWALLTAVFYVPIVRWENAQLRAAHGDAWPRDDRPADWAMGLRSERSTLVVWTVAVGLAMFR